MLLSVAVALVGGGACMKVELAYMDQGDTGTELAAAA
jgi:hypothetical protein